MAQPTSVGDLLHLLKSSDLQVIEDIKVCITESLNTERGSCLLNSLVDFYLETSSPEAISILSSVREPHDKHLLDKMNECMSKPSTRLNTLILLGHIIRRQPSWIHKISQAPVLLSLLRCLKGDMDVVVLTTGVLVLITLLPMIPQAGKQYLHEFFDIFGRLSAWYLRNPGHVPEVYMVYLQVSVYALFHRLYGMYPCNFVSYLRSHYSMKENHETFEEVVKPMLEHVRIHPELVTGTKDHELDPTRWKRFETHDIVIECAKVSLDPKESSCEEGYTTIPEHFCTHLQHRQLDPSASPFTDSQSNYGSISSTPFSTPKVPVTQPSEPQFLHASPLTAQPLSELQQDVGWSPAVECGMCTPPPTCQEASPSNLPPDLSQSASYISSKFQSTPSGKETPSGTPATSPPPSNSDEYEHISLPPVITTPSKKDGKTENARPLLSRQHNITHREKAIVPTASENTKTVTLQELPRVIEGFHSHQNSIEKEKEEAAITEELSEITTEQETALARGSFDSPFNRTTETLTGCQKKYHPQSMQCSNRQSLYHTEYNSPCTSDKLDSSGTRNTPSQERCVSKGTFTPIEMPSNCSPPGARTDQDSLEISVITPSPHKVSPRENSGSGSRHSVPFDYLFDLALPKTAVILSVIT